MAHAQVCICGHIKADHIQKWANKKTTRVRCDWHNCDCEKFRFDRTAKTFSKPVSRDEALPTFIDATYKKNEPKKQKLLIHNHGLGDCDQDGKYRPLFDRRTFRRKNHYNTVKTNLPDKEK